MAIAWLRDLEDKVKEAAERVAELRAENRKLVQRVEELETRLEAAPSDDDASAWSAERDEIRQRVEKLVEHLGELLED